MVGKWHFWGIVVTSPEKIYGGEQISSFLLGDPENLGMLFIIYIYVYPMRFIL